LRRKLRQRLDACKIAASGAFDAGWYLRRYSDVAASRKDPLMHFVCRGAEEGRDATPHALTARYLHAYGGENLSSASLSMKQD